MKYRVYKDENGYYPAVRVWFTWYGVDTHGEYLWRREVDVNNHCTQPNFALAMKVLRKYIGTKRKTKPTIAWEGKSSEV